MQVQKRLFVHLFKIFQERAAGGDGQRQVLNAKAHKVMGVKMLFQ